MNSKQHIELALRGAKVAKTALELLGASDDLVAKLVIRELINDTNDLVKFVNATAKGS